MQNDSERSYAVLQFLKLFFKQIRGTTIKNIFFTV